MEPLPTTAIWPLNRQTHNRTEVDAAHSVVFARPTPVLLPSYFGWGFRSTGITRSTGEPGRQPARLIRRRRCLQPAKAKFQDRMSLPAGRSGERGPKRWKFDVPKS